MYFPFGSHHEFPLGRNEDVGGRVRVGGEAWVYIDGGCEIRLPVGVPLRVRILKGPEYRPLDKAVTLRTGQMSLRFIVERWSDVRADGWHPGDIRSHFLTPHVALLEAAAEDVAVAHLLACETTVPGQDGHLYSSAPQLVAFSGQKPAVESDAATVAVNTLNAHPVLGKVGLLHSHRVVFPLAFGGADYPDDWSVCDWCDQCHRKNGLTVWAEPTDTPAGGEALVALILGKIDAFEYDGRTRKQPALPFYYRLLNAGFHVPLVGGSGKDSNRAVLGSPRTYAKLSAVRPISLAEWVETVRSGRSFVTNGPLLRLKVGGHDGVGEVVEAVYPFLVSASAESISAFDKLEVVANGIVVRTVSARAVDGRWTASLEVEYVPQRSGWLAARAVGETGSLLNPEQTAFAHTSPVRIDVPGMPADYGPARRVLGRAVGQTREWVEQHGRFTADKFRRHLLALCDEVLAKLAS